ncbi:hypothetical protein [Tsuneonella sp. SYSU-LHT278]|uniref:hypothetical protein n=1 Tax=Tsuneonella sediminis TaxID=3416089 RepID=UPI003F7A4C09
MRKDRSRSALAYCSTFALAIGLVAGATEGRAQSFQGNGTFSSGSGSISTGTGTTTVDITSSDAVINWTVFPGLDTTNPGVPIIFQPAGTTATFQSTADFSVLNRILPTDPSRPIQFNGTVISQLQLQSNVPGGTVYFYTPGGIIIGSSAVFNVGNLGLTSIDPAVVGGVFEQSGAGGEFVQFNGAVRPGSAVTIQPGAQITGTAPGLGSYLAIVAPVINQGGAIDGKRVSALVSADAATITLRTDGLFDIQVTSGTSGTGTTLSHTGTTTGPAGDIGNASRIYMVAVPKNDAITMAIGAGSSLGFDIADAADVDGNAVVLSAGYDVLAGEPSFAPSAGGGSGQASIAITGSQDFTSAVTAKATSNTFVFANGGEVINFASNLSAAGAQGSSDPNFNGVQVRASGAGSEINVAGTLLAEALDPKIAAPASGFSVTNFAAVDADAGGAITVGGDVIVENNQAASAPGAAVTTGSARIAASSGGSIAVGGSAFVGASAFTDFSGSATGGNASVTASGGTVAVGGVTRVHAYGIAGSSNGAGGSGGTGTGGTAILSVNGGGSFSTDELNVAADGVGGADSGSGAGAGFGGTARIFASDAGSTISVANGNVTGQGNFGDLDFLSAEAFGGWTSGGGDATGGAATGGTATIDVLNGAVLNGPATTGSFGLIRIIARATGGTATVGGTTGGTATGGSIFITVDNATMTSADLLPSSFAQGGGVPFSVEPPSGVVNGGNAFGGIRNVTVRNGGILTTALPGGGPGAVGGNGTDAGRGGDASGGSADLTVDNATFNATGQTLVFSQNAGGNGGIGGNATGGSATIAVLNGGTITVDPQSTAPLLQVSANSFGGNSAGFAGTIGGNATAGTAQLFLDNGTIDASSLIVQARGVGGGGQVGQAGNGTGGTARLQMRGGAIRGGSLQVDASGDGGTPDEGTDGNGGSGQGGFATLEATGGSTTLDFTNIEVRADGLGGTGVGTGGNGGAGIGGAAQIFATNGATLNATASEFLVVNVDAFGGFASGTGDGGSGTAGSARVIVNNGNVTLNGDLEVDGNAVGGDGVNGGHGFANPDPNAHNAFIGVNNGSLTVTGFTALDGDISGGDGRDGGNGGNAGSGFAQVFAGDNNGTGLRGTISLQDVIIEASSNGGSAFGTGNGGTAGSGRAWMFVNGGDIDVGGFLELEADATGGDGVNGGDAISVRPFRTPRALIGSFNGTIDVAGTAVFSAATFGGNATQPGGGRGGTAFSGTAGIEAQSVNGPSRVSVGDLVIDVSASGGFGGEGLSGQAGGVGGDAYGGFAFALGNAGRGVLEVNGTTTVLADGFGGFGGAGGSGGTTAPGANGGTGGRGFGGGMNIGTASGVDTPSNTGSATFGVVNAVARGFGGAGGDGGSGTTVGNGGNGGLGYGGFAGLLVRGSPVTFGDFIFDGSGFGGDGGFGTTAGAGGDGYAGDLGVTVTQRFNRTERGSLTAGNIVFSAHGFGGTGSVDGLSFYSAGGGTEGGLFIRQSDVNVNSISLTTTGDSAPNASTTVLQVLDTTTGVPVLAPVTVTAQPFNLLASQSTVNIASGLSISTPGQMLVSLDNSAVNTGALTLHAGNFVLPATRPATLGTFTVGSLPSIATGLDFLAYANFAFPGGFLLDLDGSVLTGSIATDGDIELLAAGSITTDALTGAGVTLDAGSSLATGAIVSGQTIDLTAGGAITTGALTSGDSVFVDAGGALVTGAVSAGLVNPVSSPVDGYRIGLRSQVGITAGNLSAATAIGVSSPGAIAVGDVNASQLFLALPGTSLTTGSITTSGAGQIYIASNSMEALGGTVGGGFDPAPILASQPVPVGGPVTISGQILTGILRGASTGLFQTNTIGATSVQLSGDAGLRVLSTTASGSIDLRSTAGAVSTDNLNAGDSVFIAAANGVTINGSAQAGIANPSTAPGAQYKVAIAGGSGPVSAGAVSALRDLGIQTSGAITTGNLAGRDVLLLAGGSLTTGSITAPGGAVYFGNASAAGSVNNVFQPFRGANGMLPIFSAVPIAIGGSASFGGAIQANSLWGAGTGALSAQGISASSFIDLSFGGLATVGGAWRSPGITVVSGDIAITSAGSLDALSSSGVIELATTNAAGMFIGDGLGSPAGYVLDNAEFARIRGGEIVIVGADTAQATDMTIGNLTVTGSQLYGAGGTLILATGNRETETPAGILRVSGAINATDFAASTALGLLSGTVEIEATGGSVRLADPSGGLGGIVFIEANNIHVASEEILTRLRADPRYQGVIADINRPLAVARPEGVLNAAGLEIFPTDTFYIQNTGTAQVPAGFLTTFENSEVTVAGTPPSGGAQIVINGQFQTSTGTVSGAAAFALVQADPTPDSEQFAGFSSNSQLNGCVFTTGACTTGTRDPVASIASTITVVQATPLAPAPVAPPTAESGSSGDGSGENEDAGQEQEEESESAAASAPIAPPSPLINTRDLNPVVNVVEPVAGAGNPALLGSAVPEDTPAGDNP